MNRQFIVRDRAFLWAKSKDSIVLCLDGIAYNSADDVPDNLLARWEQPRGSTAAFFVAEVMRHRFGNDQTQWPQIAMEYCAGQNP